MSADLGDPAEPGISPKEKARRTMARLRAGAGGPAGAAPAAPVGTPPAPAPVAATPEPAAAALEADVGDPDEPGISPKEKARRQVARMRAQRKG